MKKTHLAAIYLTISLILMCVEPSESILLFKLLTFINLANAVRYANKQFKLKTN